MVFQFPSEPGPIGTIRRQFDRQLLETAVEGADFLAYSLVEFGVCACADPGVVVTSETANLCQRGNALSDRRVVTAPGAYHEEDRPRMSIGEDFFDVVLEG